MANELFGWMQDLGSAAKVAYEWQTQRKPGKGIDYLTSRYKDSVRKAVDALHPGRMKLKVTDVIAETPSTKTFRLERLDGKLPPFRAGQYVSVSLQIDGVLTSRPYSISSAPGADRLDLTVRDKQGGFAAPYMLKKLKAGDELETTGPAGNFYYEPLMDGKDLVFLAGGSGITPFASIIRDQAERNGDLSMQLVYGCRVPDDVIFGEELKKLARKHKNLKYKLVVSEPPKGYRGEKGFLDAKLLKKVVGEVEGKMFYVCGPNAMYDLVLQSLTELGVGQHRIRRELYGPPEDVTKEPGWPKKIKPGKKFKVKIGRKTIEAAAGEPLMNSLERNGIVVPSVCRSGECSLCRTRLVKGTVFMPAHAGVRETDVRFGYIHPCVSYPVEDIEIRI